MADEKSDDARINRLRSERFSAYLALLKGESDRGVLIIGAALLDDCLREIIRARLVPSLEREDELFGSAYSPCGDFATKIDLAYRVGVIQATARSSLHLIRKLRNDAAHASDPRDFNSPTVQSRVKELFRLNRKILETMRASLPRGVAERLTNRSVDVTSQLIEFVGWRSLFGMLVALIAGYMSVSPQLVEPLQPMRRTANPAMDEDPPDDTQPSTPPKAE